MWCNQLVSLLARMLLSLPMVFDLDAATKAAAGARLAQCTAEEAAVRLRMQSLEQLWAAEQPPDEEHRRELRRLDGQLEQLGRSQARGQPVLRVHELTVRHVRRHLLATETSAEAAW